MKRILEGALESWAVKRSRKPLVLRGARQVGKSYLVRDWGRRRYGSVVELNFEREPGLAQCFAGAEPKTIVRRIEALTGKLLRPDGTNLLFLDEIQAAPELLAKLRWFAEELPQLPAIAAGSLLDFVLAEHQFSMPVGRVTYLHLEPMGFEEMLEALDETHLLEVMRRLTVHELAKGQGVVPALHEKLLDFFRLWLVVGGMPAVLAAYVESRSLLDVAPLQHDLLATIRDDFGKYADRAHHRRLLEVLDSVPQQLGEKFTLARVNRDERAGPLKNAVDLLCLARVCHRVRASPAERPPLAAGVDPKFFKLIMADVGLSSAALGLKLEQLEATRFVAANQGGVCEQAVGQLLRLNFQANLEPGLFYWRRGKQGAEAEVDYVIQDGHRLVPIEVKAGATGTLKSLHALMAARRWKLAVRFNTDVPTLTAVAAKTTTGDESRYQLLSLPMYLVEQLPRLLSSAS